MSCKMFDPGVVPRSDLLLCGKGWMEDMAQLQLAGQGRAEQRRGEGVLMLSDFVLHVCTPV
jgi:hypothetical protein